MWDDDAPDQCHLQQFYFKKAPSVQVSCLVLALRMTADVATVNQIELAW